MMEIKRSLVTLLSATVLASCSGGGGSSSPPAPPPPPPVSTSPTAVLTATSTSADELQSLILDASGSNDADGDSLTFTWSQTSGSTIALQDNGNTAEISIPELTSDAGYGFQVSVSDGTNSDTANISITGTNIVLSPVTSKIGTPRKTIANLDSPQSVIVVYDAGIGLFSVAAITGSGSSSKLSFFQDALNPSFFGDNPTDLSENSVAGQTSVTDGIYGTSITDSQIALGFQNEGIVRVFSGSWQLTPALQPRSQVSVPDVCALASEDLFGDAAFDDIVAGQKGGGIRILINNAYIGRPSAEWGHYDTNQQLKTSGEYCHIIVQRGINSKIFAFNKTDGLIYVWEKQSAGNIVELTPIDIGIPVGLDLVQLRRIKDAQGFFIIAALVSDGSHVGDHRVIVLHNKFDGTGSTTRIERSWTRGIPSDIIIENERGGTQTPDLIISLSSVPYIMTIENSAAPSLGDTGPLFGQIEYSETQFGATELHDGVIITYRDEGIIEVVRDLTLD